MWVRLGGKCIHIAHSFSHFAIYLLKIIKICGNFTTLWQKQQELSYRKQIARQLRTQFVEGITVTLKSTLRVTQGHWKRNHWTDHTRLTIGRVNWTLNIIVTLKCGSEVTQGHWWTLNIIVTLKCGSEDTQGHWS